MMKKTGFLKFSFMASVMVMGMYSSGAMADIASKSYVAQQIADAVKPVQQINDDLATLQGVIGETSMFGNRTIIGEIDDLRKSATGSDSKVGNLDDLKTDEKTTVVGAINETNDKIGDLSKIDEGIDSVADALSSTKYMFEQLTGVIEGAWEAVGEPSNLLTTAKANVVEAVNENRTNIGDMGILQGGQRDLVSAINAVRQEVADNKPTFTENGNGNVVTSINEDGSYVKGIVTIPVGNATNPSSYAQIWIE